MDPRLYEIPAHVMGNNSPIRRFNDSGIQEQIDRAVRGLGEKHGSVILHGDQNGNAALTTVARLGEHWSVVVSVLKPDGGKFEGEGAVAFSW